MVGMTSKDAVVKALADLVAREVISADQAAAVGQALTATEQPSVFSRFRLAEVAGYVGGGLMFGGAALLIATSWSDLSRAGKVGLLASVTAALIVAATVASGRWRRTDVGHVRQRMAGVLYGIAALTGAFAAGEAVDEHSTLLAGAVGLVLAVGGYVLVPTAVGVLPAAGLSAVLVSGLVEEIGSTQLRMLFAFVVLALLWALVTRLGVVRHRATGLACAAIIGIVGGQLTIGDPNEPWGYGVTFAIAVGCVVWYLLERDLILLIAGVVATTISVPEAIWDWTNGAVNGAVLVLVAGAVLLIASGIGLRIHHQPPAAP
jgi:hypothetical protein